MKTKTTSIWYGWWQVLSLILFAVAIAFLMNSCTSKSSTIYNQKYEKCVVLETSHPVYYMYSYTEGYKYRLKRIENQNTITTMYNPNIWNVGDTILLRFTQPE